MPSRLGSTGNVLITVSTPSRMSRRSPWPNVLHVGFRERFARAEAAARIREQHEIALARKQSHVERPGPGGLLRRRRPAVHGNHHRVFLRRIVVHGIHQPALHIEIVALPVQFFRLAPERLQRVVGMGSLRPFVQRTGPYFGRKSPGTADGSDRSCRRSMSEIIVVRSTQRFIAGPDRLGDACGGVERRDRRSAVDRFGEENLSRWQPTNPAGRTLSFLASRRAGRRRRKPGSCKYRRRSSLHRS